MTKSRSVCTYAVIPAAGESRRMGRPKLLLPYGDSTVIDQVLRTWITPLVTRVIVVVRGNDAPLQARCQQYDVDVVWLPETTCDMKASVKAGLDYIEHRYQPISSDRWLLAPADMPLLEPSTLECVLSAADARPERMIVATYQGRRGHPLLIPWQFLPAIRALGQDQGIRDLLDRHGVDSVACQDPHILDDLDTREDYERLLGHANRVGTE